MVLNMSLEETILKVLWEAHSPVSIDYVRYHAKTSWTTAKTALLELLLQGEVKGVKTSKSWIFWVKKDNDPKGGLNDISEVNQA